MPEALFYELLTTTPEKRAKCFRNIPKVANPLTLVKNVGYILRSEVKERAPFADIMKASYPIRYVFNNNLVNPHHEFTAKQKHSIANWRKDIIARVEDFKQKAALVSGWFPRVKGFKAGSDPEPIEDAKRLVLTDCEVVRRIYNEVRSNSFPAAEAIDGHWALFRELQVYVVAALDYVFMFGDGNVVAVSKRVENEYLDLEYSITASLVGALASQDKRMNARFKRIRPDGFVLSQDS
jgi:hypothetical protein